MILVTGGTGLVGIHLLIELTANTENSIRAIYRKKSKITKAQKIFLQANPYQNAFLSWEKIEWIKGDITDIPSLDVAFKGITEIYHCAGFISFDPSKFNKLKKINIEGTANMVNLALDYKVEKFCHVSSIATLNLKVGEKEFNEDSHWNSEADNSVYAISKFGAEMEVMRAIQEGLNAVIINPGVVLGEGFYNSGSGIIFKRIAKGIPYYTEGATGYIGVRDVIKIMCLLMKKAAFGERFLLVAENLSNKEIIDNIAAELEVNPPEKTIGKFWVKLFAYWELVKSRFSKKPPRISLEIVDSLYEKSIYSNNKITKWLNYTFEPMDVVIKKIAKHYSSTERN